ncbi:MAG: thioesterase domain-containing protein, partial [Methylocella sp.]
MRDISSPILILSGAGSHVDPAPSGSSAPEAPGFEAIFYPGWRRYAEIGFSVEGLVEDLAAQIAERTGERPIRLIGMSVGAHLGYAAALKLQASGRQIGGFCALDPFVTSSASPTPGWKARALKTGAALLRDRRLE